MVAADEKVANDAAAVAQSIKDECEMELAEAIPALEAAISALDTLKPSDIVEVKSMKVRPFATHRLINELQHTVLKLSSFFRTHQQSLKRLWRLCVS